MKYFDIDIDFLNVYYGPEKSIIIPDVVVAIGASAFRSIVFDKYQSEFAGEYRDIPTFVEGIYINKNIKEIDPLAFYDCETLKTIVVDPDNPYYCSIDGILYSKDRSTLIYYPSNRPGCYFRIPRCVTTIECGAFYNSLNLRFIEMYNKVTEIRSYAFAHCQRLYSIKISNQVTRIEDSTFEYCVTLRKIISRKRIVFDRNALMGCRKLKIYSYYTNEGVNFKKYLPSDDF